jgi:hypothetical protein
MRSWALALPYSVGGGFGGLATRWNEVEIYLVLPS